MKPKGADEIIYLPTENLIEMSLGTAKSFRPNAAKKKKRFVEESEADLYGGYEGFLVRTAVIRASDYDQKVAPQITQASDIATLVAHLAYADQEHFVVIAVNSQMKLLAIHEAAIGGSSSAAVEMKQALKVAFLTSAHACFIVHNHPGGISTPSNEDVILTRAIMSGMDCVGVPLLDSVIVARDGYTSLRERGMLK